MIGIGIDTGGTCTDAIVYDLENHTILSSAKSMTTHEKLEIGIRSSLKKLPRDLIDQAKYISLSTTLATNACVENKGGRVCLIFIGVSEKTVRESYQNYGFEGTDFMRFLDAKVTKDIAPDWNLLEEMLPEIFENYDAIAISQLQARENNGAYEKEAKARILAHKQLPVICAFELFQDLNAIKRGAGALLNARLIPVIEKFFDAVRNVLDEEQIKVPFVIMRSDGSLVSEQYSKEFPIETLLCGPTASVKGGRELLYEQQAIVIDMGGTTSDIALIKNGEPVINPDGVCVGGWRTFVRGIDIDTFALGGDTHTCYKNMNLYLEDRRAMPVSVLAENYPQVLTDMQLRLDKCFHGSSVPQYEHFVLMQDITAKQSHYTEDELEICRLLTNGPLSVCQLAELVHKDTYTMHTERLEDEGVIIRSGWTPTDAMVLRGDRVDISDSAKEAARLAAEFISASTKLKIEEITDRTYYLVKERLYCNLVRILWKDALNGKEEKTEQEILLKFAREVFAREMNGSQRGFYHPAFETDAILLGVGAPIHVFLDDVAKALHTTGRVSEYSGVTNALGAVLGDVCAYETVRVRLDYKISEWDEEEIRHIVYGDEIESYSSMDEALARAREVAEIRAKRKAYACGAATITDVSVSEKIKKGATNLGSISLGADVTACAHGNF